MLRQKNETLIDRIHAQERLLRMVAHELRTPLTAAALALQSQRLGRSTRFQDVITRDSKKWKRCRKICWKLGQTLGNFVQPSEVGFGQRFSRGDPRAGKALARTQCRNPYGHSDRPAEGVRRPTTHASSVAEPAGERLEIHRKWRSHHPHHAHRTSQWVEVSVCDSGPGIPEKEQQRIFLDRVRLPQTSNRTTGYGVGLSVCRRIVEVHGGRIWVVSEPDEGACFYFTVPIWQGEGQEWGQAVLTEGEADP